MVTLKDIQWRIQDFRKKGALFFGFSTEKGGDNFAKKKKQ